MQTQRKSWRKNMIQNSQQIPPENEWLSTLQRNHLVKGNVIFQPSIFRGHLSLQGVTTCKKVSGLLLKDSMFIVFAKSVSHPSFWQMIISRGFYNIPSLFYKWVMFFTTVPKIQKVIITNIRHFFGMWFLLLNATMEIYLQDLLLMEQILHQLIW